MSEADPRSGTEATTDPLAQALGAPTSSANSPTNTTEPLGTPSPAPLSAPAAPPPSEPKGAIVPVAAWPPPATVAQESPWYAGQASGYVAGPQPQPAQHVPATPVYAAPPQPHYAPQQPQYAPPQQYAQPQPQYAPPQPQYPLAHVPYAPPQPQYAPPQQYAQPQYAQPQYAQPQYAPQHVHPAYMQPQPMPYAPPPQTVVHVVVQQQPMMAMMPYARAGTVVRTGNANRVVYAILAFLLGWIGLHKFYQGKPFWGLLYMLTAWTGVPAIVSWIEGLVALFQTDMAFDIENNVQVL
ncbi:MAG: TM2 domain-containing protein [Deltaproteobacteria bacterium]|nr:TM2 domain-containing protein [Deltaproteobacteria bacterium]